MQTFTFYASDDKLENRGNTVGFTVRLFSYLCFAWVKDFLLKLNFK